MLDFFIKDFNQSHGFEAKNGLIIDHIGSLFFFFSTWPFFCVVSWVICFMFGVV